MTRVLIIKLTLRFVQTRARTNSNKQQMLDCPLGTVPTVEQHGW